MKQPKRGNILPNLYKYVFARNLTSEWWQQSTSSFICRSLHCKLYYLFPKALRWHLMTRSESSPLVRTSVAEIVKSFIHLDRLHWWWRLMGDGKWIFIGLNFKRVSSKKHSHLGQSACGIWILVFFEKPF